MVARTKSELHCAETVLRLKGMQGFYTYAFHNQDIYEDKALVNQGMIS